MATTTTSNLRSSKPVPPGQLDGLSTFEEAEKEKSRDSDPKYKIQIGLNPKQKDTLFALRKETGVDSAAQVVRDALRVYEFLVDELSSGDMELILRNTSDDSVCRVKLL